MFLLDDCTLWQAICFPHLSTCQRKLPSGGWQGDSLSFRDSFSVWPGLGQVVQLMELLIKSLFAIPSQPSLRIYEIVAESSPVLWCFHLSLWLFFFAAPQSSKLNFAVELMLPLRYNWSPVVLLHSLISPHQRNISFEHSWGLPGRKVFKEESQPSHL